MNSSPKPQSQPPSEAPPRSTPGGTLALVATPIGNLEDMTFRAVRTLRQADLIAAEDTRRAARLCARYEITTPLTPYHAHNEHARTAHILDQVEAGKYVAVITDAGTPAISDPGFFIVREALRRGIEPVIVPGVSAVTHALVAAGLPVDRFTFLGFPPNKPGKRHTLLQEMRQAPGAYILFESPYRLTRLLREIAEIIGPETPAAVVREATKLHEECLRGSVQSILDAHGDRPWRGECTLVLRVPKPPKHA